MSIHIPSERIVERAAIVAPPLRRNRGTRTFDLHPAVHVLTIGAYALFALILCATFMAPAMVVPAAIIAASIVALFLTPGLWARVAPADSRPKQSWAEFIDEGVDTITGPLDGKAALAQILTLPALVVLLAAAIAIIKATV